MTRIIPPAGVVNGWTPEQQAQHKANEGANKPDGRRVKESPADSKDAYVKAAIDAYNADYNKLVQLQNKREYILKLMRMRPFIGQDKLEDRLDDLEKKMASLRNDLDYNISNINQTLPEPIPVPPMPVPPNQFYVCTGANLMCPCAIPLMTPTFTADPNRMVFMAGVQMGNIMDFKPLVNISSMGLCTSLTNPLVGGDPFHIPKPCVPVTTSPWSPGKVDVFIENFPALLSTDSLQCNFGGRILVIPKPSFLEGAGKQAMKEGAKKGVEEGIKKGAKLLKISKEIPGVGIVVGILFDVGEYGWDKYHGTRKDAHTFSELGDKAGKMFDEWASKDNAIDALENSGQVIRDTFSLAGQTVNIALGDNIASGAIGAVVTGVGDVPAMAADAMVGTSESLASGVTVYIADDSKFDDSDLFGDDADLY